MIVNIGWPILKLGGLGLQGLEFLTLQASQVLSSTRNALVHKCIYILLAKADHCFQIPPVTIMLAMYTYNIFPNDIVVNILVI